METVTLEKKKGGRPSKRPDAATLAELYRTHTATEIAEKYGVKDSTVRGWAYALRKRGE